LSLARIRNCLPTRKSSEKSQRFPFKFVTPAPRNHLYITPRISPSPFFQNRKP
jgi:hypothetical protein